MSRRNIEKKKNNHQSTNEMLKNPIQPRNRYHRLNF